MSDPIRMCVERAYPCIRDARDGKGVCSECKLIHDAMEKKVRPLVEALRKWKCPACGGSKLFKGYSADAPDGQPCRKCKDTDGLHPDADAALKPYQMAVRQAALLIGVSPATYSRMENGRMIDADTLLKVVNWLMAKESSRER